METSFARNRDLPVPSKPAGIAPFKRSRLLPTNRTSCPALRYFSAMPSPILHKHQCEIIQRTEALVLLRLLLQNTAILGSECITRSWLL